MVVRWGHPLGAERGKVFNRVEAVRRSLNEHAVRDFWSLYQLPHQPADHQTLPIHGDPGGICVRVFVFDLQLLDVEVLQAPQKLHPATLQRLYPRLLRLAQRALYVLGLHAGSVDILIEGLSRKVARARLTLLGANAGPPLPAPVADILARTLQQVYEATQREDHLRHPAVLEVEAEFVLASARLFEKPSGIIGPGLQPTAHPCRREGVQRVRACASSPLRLVMALRRQLAKVWRKKKPEHGLMKAGSCPLPATPTAGILHFPGVLPTTDTLRTLDTFLAVPLLLLEDPWEARQRRALGHGLWGDFTPGAQGGLTYRVLSSHWLGHPRLALSVLCLAKLVIQHVPDLAVHVPQEMTGWPAHQAFARADKEPFFRLFPALWRAIEQTATFRRYEPELRYLQEEIEAQQPWYEGLSLHHTWQLSA